MTLPVAPEAAESVDASVESVDVSLKPHNLREPAPPASGTSANANYYGAFATVVRSAVHILRRKVSIEHNFLPFHYLYIVTMSILGGVIVYAVEGDVAFVDALFLSVSASTMTGLISVDFSKWNVRSQVVIMLLVFFCGQGT